MNYPYNEVQIDNDFVNSGKKEEEEEEEEEESRKHKSYSLNIFPIF